MLFIVYVYEKMQDSPDKTKRNNRFNEGHCNCLTVAWVFIIILMVLVPVSWFLPLPVQSWFQGWDQCVDHGDCPSSACGEGICTDGQCSTTIVDDCCVTSHDCTSPECYRGVCETGKCVMYTHPHHYPCNDNDKCTYDDRCAFGECVGSPVECVDRSCQLGMCTAGSCVYVNADPLSNCSDDNVCTQNDACVFGTCTGSNHLDCALPDQCRAGTCHPQFGCVITEVQGTCDDGDACTLNDVCISGVCKGTPKTCYDNNPCTRDICHQGQCEHVDSFEGSCVHGCEADTDCEVFSPYYTCLDNSVCGDVSSNTPLIRLSDIKVDTASCAPEYGRLELRHFMDIVHDGVSYEHLYGPSFSATSLGASSTLTLVSSSSMIVGDVVRSYFFVRSVCERLVPVCYQFLNQRYNYSFQVKKCAGTITDSTTCFGETNYLASVPVTYNGCPYDMSLLVDPMPQINVSTVGSSVSVRMQSDMAPAQMTDITICIPKPEYAECVGNAPHSDCISRGCYGNLDKTLLYVTFMVDGEYSAAITQDYSFNPCYNAEAYQTSVCNHTSRCVGEGFDGFDFDTTLLTYDYLNMPLVIDVQYAMQGCMNTTQVTHVHGISPSTVAVPVTNANAMGWSDLKLHPETRAVTTNLQDLVYSSWYEMRQKCPGIPELRGVDVAFDSLDYGVLASATRTMVLVDGVWQASIHHDVPGTTMVIRVNQDVPNGWFTGQGCDTGWRYDLRTVLKHELLHGLGISSSIRQHSVGYMHNGKCYITRLDRTMVANGIPLLDGCERRNGNSVTVDGTTIYTPTLYNAGSSFSHHWHGGLMNWQIHPKKCYGLGWHEMKLLQAIGVDCNRTMFQMSGAKKPSPSMFLPVDWLLPVLVVCLVHLAAGV